MSKVVPVRELKILTIQTSKLDMKMFSCQVGLQLVLNDISTNTTNSSEKSFHILSHHILLIKNHFYMDGN